MDIVFLHGWGQHSGIWSDLLNTLHASTHLFDLPGHGKHPWQAPHFELDALVDSYAAQAPARCCVVGWSLGGMIALRWAQRHPHQVEKLAGIATTPCFGQHADWPHGAPAYMQQTFAMQVAANPEAALQNFADLMAVGELSPRDIAGHLREIGAAAPLPARSALQAGLDFLAHTDMRQNLLADPPRQAMLVLHGGKDAVVPPAAGQWLAQTLPHASLHILSRCGHAPMVSRPVETAALLKNFFDE